MKSIFRNSVALCVLVIACVFAGLNLFHVFYYLARQPPNTVFIGITHWYEDYFFYLSQLTQGAIGRWMLTNPYTTEPVSLGLTWWYNLLLGKLAPILSLEVWTVYDGSIFVLSVVYIFLMYGVFVRLFSKDTPSRLGGLLIALTSSPFFATQQTPEGVATLPVTFFYSYTPALNRLGGISHHIVQNILSLLIIVLWSAMIPDVVRASHTESSPSLLKRSVLLSLLLLLLFVVAPFYVATHALVMAATLLMYAARYRSVSILRWVLILVSLFLPILPLAAYQSRVFGQPFWLGVREWEATRIPATITQLLLSIGPLTVLVAIGVGRYVKQVTRLGLVGLIHAFLPLALYLSPLPSRLGIPYFRLLQPTAYVFLAAIGVVGIRAIAIQLDSRRAGMIFYVLTLLFVGMQVPAIARDVTTRTSVYYMNSHLNFIDRDIFDGLRFLRTLPDGFVLAVHTVETLVPPISGKTVYAGHTTLTIDYAQKIKKVAEFYALNTPTDVAREFLVKNNLTYVIWEKKYALPHTIEQAYPFLLLIYENPKLLIYKIEDLREIP